MDDKDNLRIYNQARIVPNDALKTIKAGRLKGMTDVNPMWRMKKMTEIFGPCGIGWKYTIDKQWTETYNDETKCFCNVSLFVRDSQTGQWSDAIPGTGGSAIVKQESKGPYVDDEGYKMALTDALSIAMKPLGVGADIWYGEKQSGHNESKYEENTDIAPVDYSKVKDDALKLIASSPDKGNLQDLWKYYQQYYPSLCEKNGEIRIAVMSKLQQMNNAATA